MGFITDNIRSYDFVGKNKPKGTILNKASNLKKRLKRSSLFYPLNHSETTVDTEYH